jgi:hypothetical protein
MEPYAGLLPSPSSRSGRLSERPWDYFRVTAAKKSAGAMDPLLYRVRFEFLTRQSNGT